MRWCTDMTDELQTTTSDGVKIKYNALRNSKKSALFILPGWFMTKDSKAFSDIASDFSKFYDVYTLDLRGHGNSTGLYTFSSQEIIDLRAVIEKTRQEMHYDKYFLMGFSLGGAIVINYCAEYKDVDSVIAVSAPCAFDKIENHFWKKEAFIPTFQKFELKRWLSIRPAFPFKKMVKPVDVIKNLSPVPIYLIAGSSDKTVYPWHAQKLYETALEPKKMTVFENTIHAEDIYISSPQTFVNSCYNWYEYQK